MVLTGCFFEPTRPHAGPADAASDGTSGDAQTACPNPGTWSNALPIASANTAMTERNAALSPDGKHLIFTRGDNQQSMLYMLDVTGTSFGSATATPFGADADEAAWSPAGDRLYFVVGGSDWKFATFDGTTFGTATSTSELNLLNPRIEGGLSFDGDGTEIYFDANGHIEHATGTIGGTWSGASEVTAIATANGEASAEISRDGLELLYSHAGTGNDQVWAATRSTRGAAFSSGTLVPNQVDGGRPTISGDRTLLIYNGADFDLYYATRTCR